MNEWVKSGVILILSYLVGQPANQPGLLSPPLSFRASEAKIW